MFLIGEKGVLKGLRLSFDEGEEWILGSDPNQSTYVLEDPSLPERAARVSKTPEELFFLENLGPRESVLINDRPIEEPVLLSEGDRIKIGSTTFRFSQEEAAPKAPAQTAYDDIFGSIDNPELPPEPEPLEEPASMASSQEEEEEEPAPEKKENRVHSAYDTIFEDLGEEAELPFHISTEQNAPLLLKVIAGPNAGAEIGLEKGRDYIIGKDPDSCDIVFNDLSVSRNHAHLSVSQEGILELEDLGSKNGTVVNGSKITEKSAVTSQNLIQMGTTIFLIIDREAAQETVYAPPSWHYEKEQEVSPESVAAELEVASRIEERTEDWKGKKIPLKHLIFAGSFLAIFFIISISFFSLFKSEPVEIAHKHPHEHLKEAFENIPSVHYTYNASSGKLFLTGHLLTNVSHQELLYNLGQLSMISSIEDAIIVDESVWKMMNDLLASNPSWRSVSVFSSAPGTFVARGYVPNLDQAVQLANFFTVNFPFQDRLQNKVVVEEIMSAKIVSLIQAQGFATIAPLLVNGELILSGRYNEKESSSYKELLSQLSKVDGVHLVKNLAVPTSLMATSIDLSNQYKVSGTVFYDKEGYNVVVNGRIVKVGADLDGMKLVSIEQNTILLEKDGLRYKIDYVQ